MAQDTICRAIRIIAMGAACVAFGAAPVQAMTGCPLAPGASPYAILAPVTVSPTLGGEGRAAYDGNSSGSSSRCPPSASEAATNSGLRCKLNH
jgi:hypothetical protein